VTGNLYSGVDEEFVADFYEELTTSSETLVRKGTTQHGIVSQKSAIFNKLINFTGLNLLERINFL
jgi:hypothetical protein